MSERINCSEIRKGTVFKLENNYYECMDVSFPSPSPLDAMRGRRIVNVTARVLKRNKMVKMSLLYRDAVERVVPEKTQLVYLYESDGYLCFMDSDSYDLIEAPSSGFEWEKNFLALDKPVLCLVHEDEILKIELPDEVQLTLTECDEIDFKKPQKYAVCETGLKVLVPLFLEVGEQIIVSTSDGAYKGRARSSC